MRRYQKIWDRLLEKGNKGVVKVRCIPEKQKQLIAGVFEIKDMLPREVKQSWRIKARKNEGVVTFTLFAKVKINLYDL